jgi:hypothetical protein
MPAQQEGTTMQLDPLERVRRICLALPEVEEKLSHGEPTFFVGKRVFVMFAENHHGDGRTAVWLPAPAGLQEMLVETAPQTFFKPPYVGVRGWIGIDLAQVDDADLAFHIHDGWRLTAPKKLHAQLRAAALTTPQEHAA